MFYKLMLVHHNARLSLQTRAIRETAHKIAGLCLQTRMYGDKISLQPSLGLFTLVQCIPLSFLILDFLLFNGHLFISFKRAY